MLTEPQYMSHQVWTYDYSVATCIHSRLVIIRSRGNNFLRIVVRPSTHLGIKMVIT